MTLRGPPTSVVRQKRIFDSVFPPSHLTDLAPTPSATPVITQSGFEQAGSSRRSAIGTELKAPGLREQLDVYPEAVVRDRAWHTATASLSLPQRDFLTLKDQKELTEFATRYAKLSPDAKEAISYVISSYATDRDQTEAELGERESIVDWYTNHVRNHFLTSSKASLKRILRRSAGGGTFCVDGDATQTLRNLRDGLNLLQKIYFYPLTQCIIPQLNELDAVLVQRRFHADLQALVSNALPPTTIQHLFFKYLSDSSQAILGVGDKNFEVELALATDLEREQNACSNQAGSRVTTKFRSYYPLSARKRKLEMYSDTVSEAMDVKRKRDELLRFLRTWPRVGLGADDVCRIFAVAMDQLLTKFVTWSYAGVNSADGLGVLDHLKYWVAEMYAKHIVQVLDALRYPDDEDGVAELPEASTMLSEVNSSDVNSWQEMAVTRLGALRVDELFDIVEDWDRSRSRVDDLKHYITNPSTRAYLATNFMRVLDRRLLQPGAATQQILRVYIAIIRAFGRLDPKGVLLDRVARPVRRYLQNRSDTVKTIVTGLFSDPDAAPSPPTSQDADIVNELAAELKEHGPSTASDDADHLDWDDMSWLPDPIDAAQDYKKSKNSDVIGSVLSLFESREAIAQELQSMLAERLLKKKAHYEQETAVLELLKMRMGENLLQSCSVMLRDVTSESLKIDRTIRQEQGLEKPSEGEDRMDEEQGLSPVDFHAKVLSHLYWPTLQNQTFHVPTQVRAQQHLYERGFSALKSSRKLTWVNALGQVEIELEFEDRSFRGDVTPWEASVIHAFDSTGSLSTEPITRSVDDIATELEMSPLLVGSACKLWLSKAVLRETSPDVYTVQETLASHPDSTDLPGQTMQNDTSAQVSAATSSTAAAAAETAASLAASSASSSLLEQKMAVYHQFILSLLTNQGAMPVGRITMMLGMVVPGGFPFSTDELKEFLGRMVRDGEIEVAAGGVYKAVASGPQ